VKELLKSDTICKSYAQMKKGPVLYLTVYFSQNVITQCAEPMKQINVTYLL